MSERIWERLDIVYRLKSPLHIGYMPFKGSVVSPTRYYVPGRNFWGAVTKGITEYFYTSPDADKYIKIGRQILNDFRFSYFYIYDGENAYMPEYTDDGLKFGCHEKISQREFEQKFISSRVSTAINAESGTAADGSLHETEFINNRFKEKTGELRDTGLIGCIWVKKGVKIGDRYVEIKEIGENDSIGIFIDDFNAIGELIIGGESKYGFGHIVLESINKVKFTLQSEEDETIRFAINETKPLPAPLKYNDNIRFKGEIELFVGRGYFDPKNDSINSTKPGDIISKHEYYFSPGTILMESITGVVNWDGTIDKYNI